MALVFGQTVTFDFINYDDPVYLTENEVIADGVSLGAIKWAFTETNEANLWHPVTWLSHMLDIEIWGKEAAGGHHFGNLLWHGLASVGLFFLLRSLGISPLLAVALALFWALHPQRIQSVAWMSERKDLLGGAFVIWSWWAWEKCRFGGNSARRWFALSAGLFLLAGLSKPSVIPLPVVILLGEVLRSRGVFGGGVRLKRSIVGLVPFFLIAGGVAFLTLFFQAGGGLGSLSESTPFAKRLALMPYRLWWYFHNAFSPSPRLLFVYPSVGLGQTFVIPAIGLSLVAFVVWLGRKEQLILWGAGATVLFWFPVSGIVPVSFYAVADRYAYFIHIGLTLLLAGVTQRWGGWAVKSPGRKVALGAGALLLLSLGAFTARETTFWKSSETLFERECVLNRRSLLAPIQLGLVREGEGHLPEALELYQRALSIDRESGLAATNGAKILLKLGRQEEAKALLLKAAKTKVLGSPDPFLLLSQMEVESSQLDDAAGRLEAGLARFPNHLGLLLERASLELSIRESPAGAIVWFEKALAVQPNNPDAMQGLGVALLETGEQASGRRVLSRLVELYPERVAVKNYLKKSE